MDVLREAFPQATSWIARAGLALALLETTDLTRNQALAQSPAADAPVSTQEADPSELLEYELSEVPNATYSRFLTGISELGGLRSLRTGDLVAVVDPTSQLMGVFEKQGANFVLIEAYKISTAAKGLGNFINSDKTPTGVFELENPEGKGKALGYILGPKKSHRVGKVEKNLKNGRGMALMTTRKVPVDGIEPDNKNSLARGIAVHGTNKETRLGKAASGGCIRMGNEEVVEFAEAVAAPGRAYMVIVNPKDPIYKKAPLPSLADVQSVRSEDSLEAQAERDAQRKADLAKQRAEEEARRKEAAEAAEKLRVEQERARLAQEKIDCEAEGLHWQDESCWVETEAAPIMMYPYVGVIDGRLPPTVQFLGTTFYYHSPRSNQVNEMCYRYDDLGGAVYCPFPEQ